VPGLELIELQNTHICPHILESFIRCRPALKKVRYDHKEPSSHTNKIGRTKQLSLDQGSIGRPLFDPCFPDTAQNPEPRRANGLHIWTSLLHAIQSSARRTSALQTLLLLRPRLKMDPITSHALLSTPQSQHWLVCSSTTWSHSRPSQRPYYPASQTCRMTA